MLLYPFIVIPEEDGWAIQFPDLPGAHGFAESLSEIGPEAETVAQLWIESMRKDGDPIPKPSTDWKPIDHSSFTLGSLATTKEVAEELGISPRRVRALADDRGLGVRLGNSLAFSRSEIDDMRIRIPGRPIAV